MTNDKAEMANKAQDPNPKRKYDLEERTAQFGEAVIQLVRGLRQDAVNTSLISQLVRAGTSVGANYMEADGAESRKAFRYRISVCKKESKGTKHWLRMIANANPRIGDECLRLLQEAQELSLIFSSILLHRNE